MMNKQEITINFAGITEYLKDKDIEIDYLRYENNKNIKKIQHLQNLIDNKYKKIQNLQNLIDKATNYYLKELSQCSHMDDVAVEMYNLLEGHK